ncbi:MAG: hypothetical protein HOY79_47590 [Streptomyces sp.]|nr:hypothetical protein [Streptomyces sp.]
MVAHSLGGMVGSETERIGVVLVHGFVSSSEVWNNFEQLITSNVDLGFVTLLPFSYASPKLQVNPLRRIPDINDIADSLQGYLSVEAGKCKRLVLPNRIVRHRCQMLRCKWSSFLTD